jgi:hypothetical protein
VQGAVKLREDEFERWWTEYGVLTISPGGAAAMAGIPWKNRSAVYNWIARGQVRAWEFQRGDVYVHIGDVLREAVRLGYRSPRRVAKLLQRLEEIEGDVKKVHA